MAQIQNGKFQSFDNNGDPLSGGKLYTYESGTSTPKATYSDSGLVTANANPVVMNSRGEADIWGSGRYKLVLKDSDDVEIWTVDGYTIGGAAFITDSDGDTQIQVEKSSDEDIIRFDIEGTEELTIQDGKIEPTTDDDVDLGSSSKEFKDLYLDGIAYIDQANIDKLLGGVVVLGEEASAPTTAANQGALYTKEKDGQTELYFREESDGDEILLTNQGASPLPRSYLAGLGISNGTDADHDIDIAVGEARDTTNAENLILGTAMTKQLDAVWAVGTDAGGLFTGTIANATWYHVFLIRKDSDGSIDVGFDTSITAANIPTGYTEYRRIGSVLTDGSANILAFYQSGNMFGWDDPPLDLSAVVTAASRDTVALTVPPDVRVEAIINITTTPVNFVYASVLDANDEDPSVTAAPLANMGGDTTTNAPAQLRILTNTSKQIGLRSDDVLDTVYVATIGWVDRRGRDD